MKEYILIAGVNGTGKSSFRGVLEGQGVPIGHIVDPDLIAKQNNYNELSAGKQAVREIQACLQKGETIESNGKFFTPDMVLGTPRKGLKVTYCTDTRPTPEMAGFAQNSDLFVCEGMYANDDMLEQAVTKRHMLFSEAAKIARDANVSELWLTHFSPSLKDPYEYKDFASSLFENTVIPYELQCKCLEFERK